MRTTFLKKNKINVLTQNNQILKKADQYVYFNSTDDPINSFYLSEDLTVGKLW